MVRTFSWVTLALALFAAGTAEAYYPLWKRQEISYYANVRSIVAADFNGDGQADVVTRNSSNQLRLYLMTGAGAWPEPAVIYTGTTLTDLIAADVTGDGNDDLILAESATDAVTVLPANGDGTFGAPIHSSLAVDPLRLAKADFNSDGSIDLAVRSGLAVALYAGDGAGNFSLLLNRGLTSAPSIVQAGDIDADGKGDYVVGFADATPYEILFGKGDGTFETPVPISSVTTNAARMAIEDLDADGDREILIPHFAANTLTVIVNNGRRTFASPVVYEVLPAPPAMGNPFELIVGDVNGDGDADVVMTLSNERLLATYTGKGDGSLNAGAYVSAGAIPGAPFYPQLLAGADFSGDGRIDIALVASTHLELHENVSGDITVGLDSVYRTITEGQTATFYVTVQYEPSYYAYPPPAITGTITLKRDGADVGSGDVNLGTATIEVPSLPLGTHAITAHYSGDENYRATVSNVAPVNVVEEATTVTISSTAAGTEVPYGQSFAIVARVTSELEGSLEGQLKIFVDGEFDSLGHGSYDYFDFSHLSPGTHTFYVTFEGTETQPPSRSAVITQVVKKAASTINIGSGSVIYRYNRQQPLLVTIAGNGATGTVRFYEGDVLLATVSVPASSFEVPLSLPVGAHDIHATYSGDDNYEPSTSPMLRYVVMPADSLLIDASVQGTAIHVRGMYDLPSGGHFEIWRRIGSGGWIVVGESQSPSWDESNPQAGTPYLFRIEAYDSSNRLVVTSNTDMAMLWSFTDDPLPSGTIIKALHLTEIVAAVNALRIAAGMSAVGSGMAPGQVIRGTHVQHLRTLVNAARQAVGLVSKPFIPGVEVGLPMRAMHIYELREAIR